MAIVPREGASVTEQEIQAFAAEQLADYKVPRRVAIVTDIPLGPTGKLQRIGLAERLGVDGDVPERRAARAGACSTDRARA